jgi:hypothetical protein
MNNPNTPSTNPYAALQESTSSLSSDSSRTTSPPTNNNPTQPNLTPDLISHTENTTHAHDLTSPPEPPPQPPITPAPPSRSKPRAAKDGFKTFPGNTVQEKATLHQALTVILSPDQRHEKIY